MGKVELFGIEVNELKPKAAKRSKSKRKARKLPGFIYIINHCVSCIWLLCETDITHKHLATKLDGSMAGREGRLRGCSEEVPCCMDVNMMELEMGRECS